MKKSTLIKATITILIALVFLAIIVPVLTKKGGIIDKEKEKYNQTHVEEINEKNNNRVVVKK